MSSTIFQIRSDITTTTLRAKTVTVNATFRWIFDMSMRIIELGAGLLQIEQEDERCYTAFLDSNMFHAHTQSAGVLIIELGKIEREGCQPQLNAPNYVVEFTALQLSTTVDFIHFIIISVSLGSIYLQNLYECTLKQQWILAQRRKGYDSVTRQTTVTRYHLKWLKKAK